ncbi:MAG: 4Fe-4S binding protein [Lachnospiraceae bacterium]|nr:4Fe-4S binding protein [Lachnospiraceae bacterium]
MEKLIVLSAVSDNVYSQKEKYLLDHYFEDIKKAAEAFAAENEAELIWLLAEEFKTSSFISLLDLSCVCFGIATPTGDNGYSCVQQLMGNLPRPMIQDDFTAEYEGKKVLVLTVEEALKKAEKTFIAVTVDGEVKEASQETKLSELAETSGTKAVLIGGLKGHLIRPEELSEYTVEDYDSITVIPKSSCIVDFMIKHINNAWNSSCGKCVLCREGSLQYKTICEEMVVGKAKPADLELIKETGELIKAGAYCPYGQHMPQPLIDAISLFTEEFEAHIKKKQCPAGVCYKKGATYVILPDKCTGCTDCMDECDELAIEGKKGFIHMIDQDMCEHCGKCVEICDEEAIIQVDGKMPKLPKKLTRVGKF